MTTAGWRLYNWYLIVGMGLFFILAFFGPHKPEPEIWQEFAHYDPALVEGGIIRGTVRYNNAADCTARARTRYHYEWIDIVGVKDVPTDGINGPYVWGCQKIERSTGRSAPDIRR